MQVLPSLACDSSLSHSGVLGVGWSLSLLVSEQGQERSHHVDRTGEELISDTRPALPRAEVSKLHNCPQMRESYKEGRVGHD